MVELGVSKSSCLMCRESILAVQVRYRHITVRVSSCHEKHDAGWSLPVVAPRGLIEHVGKRVRDEMDEVLQRTTRNRRSDSVPMGSGFTDGVERPSAEEVVQGVEEEGGGDVEIALKLGRNCVEVRFSMEELSEILNAD